MPNTTQKFCDFPGCTSGQPDANDMPTPYVTPPGLPTREEVAVDLRQHVETAHMLQIGLAEVEGEKTGDGSQKIRDGILEN